MADPKENPAKKLGNQELMILTKNEETQGNKNKNMKTLYSILETK